MKNEKVQKVQSDSKKKAVDQSNVGGYINPPPTLEQIAEWTKKDLDAALSLLMLLKHTPKVFERVVSEIQKISIEVEKQNL